MKTQQDKNWKESGFHVRNKPTSFNIYNKNVHGISIVTAVVDGLEELVFGTASVTQSRKALANHKRVRDLKGIPVETLLDQSYDANIALSTPDIIVPVELILPADFDHSAPVFEAGKSKIDPYRLKALLALGAKAKAEMNSKKHN